MKFIIPTKEREILKEKAFENHIKKPKFFFRNPLEMKVFTGGSRIENSKIQLLIFQNKN
jgi:hypothetical protein